MAATKQSIQRFGRCSKPASVALEAKLELEEARRFSLDRTHQAAKLLQGDGATDPEAVALVLGHLRGLYRALGTSPDYPHAVTILARLVAAVGSYASEHPEAAAWDLALAHLRQAREALKTTLEMVSEFSSEEGRVA